MRQRRKPSYDIQHLMAWDTKHAAFHSLHHRLLLRFFEFFCRDFFVTDGKLKNIVTEFGLRKRGHCRRRNEFAISVNFRTHDQPRERLEKAEKSPLVSMATWQLE